MKMSQPTIPRNWRDLAALLDPVGRCDDPLAEGRPLDWCGIYALAAGHFVAPALYSALSATDRLRMAPAEVREALSELHRLNSARNNRHRIILRDTVRILKAQGIELLLMKGSITLLPGQPAYATARMMGDLDIALRNAEPERGEAALCAAGYWRAVNQGPWEYRDLHHLAPLFHPSREGYVEIHRDLLSAKVPAGILSLTEAYADAEPVEWDGLKLWIPSIAHRLVHNALHQQIQDARLVHGDQCSMRQVLEFAQLRALPEAAEIDWNSLLKRLDVFGVGEPVRAYLLVAKHLFGQPLPAGVHPSKAARRIESRMWFRLTYPKLHESVMFASRLRYLPQRLMTPEWYPEKYRYLRQRWARYRDRGTLRR